MVEFTTTILKFDRKGEKSGWTYIEIPADLAQQLKPGNKKTFRVHGKLDNHYIQRVAVLPMGSGDFILPLNASLRKAIGKGEGAMLKVKLHLDKSPYLWDRDFFNCLLVDMEALRHFKTLPKSSQDYFSKWVQGAKTEDTKAKRIAQSLKGLAQRQNFSQMMRALRENK